MSQAARRYSTVTKQTAPNEPANNAGSVPPPTPESTDIGFNAIRLPQPQHTRTLRVEAVTVRLGCGCLLDILAIRTLKVKDTIRLRAHQHADTLLCCPLSDQVIEIHGFLSIPDYLTTVQHHDNYTSIAERVNAESIRLRSAYVRKDIIL
jgi:hypothetical protein